MADCEACLAGNPYSPSMPGVHRGLGPMRALFTCKRGPIERELGAHGGNGEALSPATDEFARGVVADMLERGYLSYNYEDWMSDAIEAAAELGL